MQAIMLHLCGIDCVWANGFFREDGGGVRLLIKVFATGVGSQ